MRRRAEVVRRMLAILEIRLFQGIILRFMVCCKEQTLKSDGGRSAMRD